MAMKTGALNVLALCSGYGGLELGLQLATSGAARCVCYVEREASAASVLVKEMEAAWLAPAPIWGDLATFDGKPWRGVVDCITAGFPCQPFSAAGKRAGTADPRWLWPVVARVIEEVNPSLVFLENVPGLRKKGLRDVLQDLATIGFNAEWGCVKASDLGAPHIRRRLFILGFRERDRLEQLVGAEVLSGPYCFASGVAAKRGELEPPIGEHADPLHLGPDVGNADGQRELREPGNELERQERKGRNGFSDSSEDVGGANGANVEGCWPPWRTTDAASGDWPKDEPEPGICRKAYGGAVGMDHRLRMLGNGVVPVVAAYAFRALVRRAIERGPA
jgi:DNA (cytosine-5)-methyltransferase 1